MKQITLNVTDGLYKTLKQMCERETDTVETIAYGLLYDTVYEDELDEEWTIFTDFEETFAQYEDLTMAMQRFTDVMVICSDSNDLSREEGHKLLLEANNMLIDFYEQGDEAEKSKEDMIAFMDTVYEEYKERLFVEAQRLVALADGAEKMASAIESEHQEGRDHQCGCGHLEHEGNRQGAHECNCGHTHHEEHQGNHECKCGHGHK